MICDLKLSDTVSYLFIKIFINGDLRQSVSQI